eukprot:6492209-Amphidinium_carterae.1
MFGSTKENGALHAKAAETVGLMRFLAFYLPRCTRMENHDVWLDGINALHSLWQLLAECPMELTALQTKVHPYGSQT